MHWGHGDCGGGIESFMWKLPKFSTRTMINLVAHILQELHVFVKPWNKIYEKGCFIKV